PNAILDPEITAPVPEAILDPEFTAPVPEAIHEQEITAPAPEAILDPEITAPVPDAILDPEITAPAPEAILEQEITEPVPNAILDPEITAPIPEAILDPEITAPIPEAILEPELHAQENEASSAPDTYPLNETTEIHDDFPVDILNDNIHDTDDDFPDIPVIDAQQIAHSAANPQENSLPDIPVISPAQDTEFPADFPTFADVVVNVDAELPHVNSDTPENTSDDFHAEALDPENEAAPVTVTMPENTKTAEDKLMANIAEAMTGSPLTLDKPDPSEPYRLPENLLKPQNDTTSSPQSAEDKLIADISQAISESPIEAAQKHAHQNFEDELSPFDEMPLPEPIQTPDFDDSLEHNPDDEEGDDFDEPFLPDFPSETEQQEDTLLGDENTAEDVGDFSELPLAEDDTALDADMPDFSLIDEPEIDTNPEPESEPAAKHDTDTEIDTEPEIATEPEPEPQPDTDTEPEPQPLTAEDRLAQELADFTHQEAPQPEHSLLDAPDTATDITEPQAPQEDFTDEFNFMDTWGDAASTMNYGDDELEHDTAPQEDTPDSQDVFSQPQMPAPLVEPVPRITHAPQNPTVPNTPELHDASPIWRILLQAVLGLLILAGIYSLFRLHQLTDNITAMTLYGTSQAGISAQSYDYAVDMIPDGEISPRMRLRGIEGWKLVGSRRSQDAATGRYAYEFIFMRPTPANH
ncbi:MAG: hypothetical protein IJU26_04650, partial [Synergistaceae bacterium]|nr:hypothetical protein [Synergistaceae bacterium]